jgi:hypothetical protein
LFRDADILELARSEAQAFVGKGGEALRSVARYIQDHWQRQYGLVLVG